MNSLLVFYEVIKARSFSKAADVLFMTQPGVSNHVSQLEAQAGHRLLKREKGKFELTKEGKVVFKYAEKIEALATDLEHAIRNLRKDVKPLLRIGSPPVYSRIVMPYILSSFQKTYPDTMIRLDTGASEEMLKSVLSMHNDIVIVANTRASKKLYVLPFIKEELVLITAKKHPLAQKDSVHLKEVEPYPFILREEGSGTRNTILGVSILVKRAVADDELDSLKIVSLKERLSMEISVCFLKSRKNDRVIQGFSDHVTELSQKPPFKAGG